MTTSRIATSPFNCYWIARGSEGGLDYRRFAICERGRAPRVVSEHECARCVFWRDPEPPACEAACRVA